MDFQKEIQKEYEAFLQEVINCEEVWFLQNEEGMACQDSLEYEGQMSILVWSNGVLAEAERDGDFEALEAFNLPLIDFMYEWLPNMQNENVICALNWESEEGGLEVEPKDLLAHLELILPENLSQKYQKELEG